MEKYTAIIIIGVIGITILFISTNLNNIIEFFIMIYNFYTDFQANILDFNSPWDWVIIIAAVIICIICACVSDNK